MPCAFKISSYRVLGQKWINLRPTVTIQDRKIYKRYMNSFAQLTSVMTSSSTVFFLLLVFGPIGRVTSDGTSMEACLNEELPWDQKEWNSSSSVQIIQVSWNFDKVCASVEQCYRNGSSDVDFIKINQLPPIQIQPNQFIAFRSEKPKVLLEYFRVNEEDFEGCNAEGGQLLDVGNDTFFGVATGHLTIGNNYFIANSVNGSLQWKCSPYGLRVNVTVQPHNCSEDHSSSDQLCGGHGRCLARIYEPNYNCQCCPGFVGAYCEKQDGCANITCQFGGTCVDGLDDISVGAPFSCSCIPGFRGTHCETLEGEMCETNECMNSGICLREDSVPPFRCVCPLGFTGKVCETNIDECASSPCHNGRCNDLINRYSCTCYNDFSGVDCETYIGLCPADRCKNGATCEPDLKNEFATCRCHPGYTGTSCETKVELCHSNPCVNSIDCVDYGDNYKCVCHPGYTGANCEVNVDECASNPCHSGGTCHDNVAAFSCDCPEGLSPPTCDSPPDNSTDGSGKGTLGPVELKIIASVLSCLVVIAFVVLIVYCCVVRKPYKLLRRKKYVHIVDEKYESSSDVAGAHPSPDFVADPVAEDDPPPYSGSAKSPLVRRAKHREPSRI